MSHPLLQATDEVLGQGETLLLALSDAQYTATVPAAFNASVGGHVRHCLEHFQSLLDGLDRDEINYDARARDPQIEGVRAVALAALRAQRHALAATDAATLARSVHARTEVSSGAGASPAAISTVEREIMYCVVHAIHHFALVGVMCGLLDVRLPEGFGVAPSTLKHRRQTAPAAS